MSEIQKNAPLISQLLATWIKGENSESYTLANYANAAAILFQNMTAVNWAGFYLYHAETNTLALGPFLGKPATALITPDKGVVGNAFTTQKTIVVPNVRAFSGHIVCDVDSNSEIVIPITTANGQKIGVLDIDSTQLDRFSKQEQADLEHFVQTLIQYIEVS
ncbi:GAF domain-containing protein [uncultured Leuconostoc sp.]|uniref:GAF domain-containing protein n=1 Tax=uncultured Leuconostoc sp. TaxID=173262 RepID=UPI0025DC6486|nr:GAF domain-containing protein [uncultured Leuconostoc sp.]